MTDDKQTAPEQSTEAGGLAEPIVRAFAVECCGIAAVTFATSAAKARYCAAFAAWDAGYMDTANPAKAKARRAPEHDHRAAKAKPRVCYGMDYLP